MWYPPASGQPQVRYPDQKEVLDLTARDADEGAPDIGLVVTMPKLSSVWTDHTIPVVVLP